MQRKTFLGGITQSLQGLGQSLFGFTNRRESYMHDGGIWYPIGNTTNIVAMENLADIERAYFQCSTLQTVILNKAQAASNGVVKIVNDNGKEKPLSREILKRMEKPNVFQNYDQFRTESKVLVQLFGWHIVWYVKNVAGGFVNIWNLNPVNTLIKYKGGKYLKQTDLKEIIESVQYRYAGNIIDVPLDEIYIVKDSSNTRSTDTILAPPIFPTSRIVGLKMVVSNNIAAYDARNSMIATRGAQGFISPDQKDSASALPLLEEDQQHIKRQFQEGHGILRNQSKFVFSPKGIKFQPINMKTADLMLFEETEDTMLRIVDVYGYKKELLATLKQTTFTNQEIAWKALYQDTIIPEDKNELPALFAGWKLEENGLHVESDFSHVEALVPDPKAREEVNQIQINNIAAINAMPVDYDTKINIAMSTLEVDEETARKLISNGAAQTTKPNAN